VSRGLDGSMARRRRARAGFRPWLTVGWLLVIGAAFGGGYLLAQYDAQVALSRIQSLQTEAARLTEDLAAAKQAHVRLERAHLMDREAKRAAQHELAELEQERMRLAKQVVYLQRLISKDDAGVVEVQEAVLRPLDEPGHYHYRLTLSQLVPAVGRAEGDVTLKVAVIEDSEEVIRTLDELPGSSSARRRMGFEHFQALSGTIVLPAGAEPQRLIVDVDPSTEGLIPSSQAFLWLRPEAGDQRLMVAAPEAAGERAAGLE